MSAIDPLFQPLKVGSLDLPNRIVMAPMTRAFTDAGVPKAEVAEYYAARAAGGTGLILSEGVTIARPASKNAVRLPNFYGVAIDRWRTVVEAVHAVGGHFAPQLWHMGAAGPGDMNPMSVDTPSGLELSGEKLHEPMTDAAIADTIAAYASSAGNAVGIGSDAIELHAAHGYLIDQFFWTVTNRRHDRWGGASIAERARFGVEIVKAVRREMPADMPLSLRISQWKTGYYDAMIANTPSELEAWLLPFVDAGVDIFHCSQRRYAEAAFPGSGLNLAGWAKKITGRTTITVGSIGLDGTDFTASLMEGKGAATASLEDLNERLARGEFDLVAVGRAIIANPDWANRIKAGSDAQLRQFTPEMLHSL